MFSTEILSPNIKLNGLVIKQAQAWNLILQIIHNLIKTLLFLRPTNCNQIKTRVKRSEKNINKNGVQRGFSTEI